MTNTKFDARQSICRSALDQVAPSAGTQANTIFTSINNELTMPLRMSASSTPDLVLNIGSISLTNPQTNKKRILPFIYNAIPSFTSGTITFPSVSSNNITFSTGGSTATQLICTSGKYVKVLIYMDSVGDLGAIVGSD
jgi:hypothetical protein